MPCPFPKPTSVATLVSATSDGFGQLTRIGDYSGTAFFIIWTGVNLIPYPIALGSAPPTTIYEGSGSSAIGSFDSIETSAAPSSSTDIPVVVSVWDGNVSHHPDGGVVALQTNPGTWAGWAVTFPGSFATLSAWTGILPAAVGLRVGVGVFAADTTVEVYAIDPSTGLGSVLGSGSIPSQPNPGDGLVGYRLDDTHLLLVSANNHAPTTIQTLVVEVDLSYTVTAGTWQSLAPGDLEPRVTSPGLFDLFDAAYPALTRYTYEWISGLSLSLLETKYAYVGCHSNDGPFGFAAYDDATAFAGTIGSPHAGDVYQLDFPRQDIGPPLNVDSDPGAGVSVLPTDVQGGGALAFASAGLGYSTEYAFIQADTVTLPCCPGLGWYVGTIHI